MHYNLWKQGHAITQNADTVTTEKTKPKIEMGMLKRYKYATMKSNVKDPARKEQVADFHMKYH